MQMDLCKRISLQFRETRCASGADAQGSELLRRYRERALCMLEGFRVYGV